MIIIDDFVKDPMLLHDIQDDPVFFGRNGQYMWWNGWWNTEATSPKQRLIEYIWNYNCPVGESFIISGFEYWTNQFEAGSDSVKLDLHFDKDEELWDTKKELHTPLMGTVFYPIPMDIDGGYLEIQSKEGDLIERIQAKYNRLIIFPAGEYPHRVTEVTRGKRSAIAINLWEDEPLGVKEGKNLLEFRH